MLATNRALGLLALTVALALSAAAEDVRIWEEPITLPTYAVQPADPNPRFEEGRVYQGARGPVYPYAMLDSLTDVKVDRTYTALYLENEYVRICVLPEIGGRIFEALDKTNGYDFFYRQHVIKPDLIGMLGAWISGGVEWCVFHHHRNTTFMPVDYLLTENPDGSKTIWIGEIERRHRMKWTIGMTLSPGCSRLDVTVKLFNRTPYTHSVLYWANVAIHATDGYQVIFPPSVQFATYHGKNEFTHWPISKEVFHGMDYTKGGDVSWWKNHPAATSLFAWNPQEDFFAGYDHDKRAGVAHVADHNIAPGMKLWTWGTQSTWDRTKLTDSDGPYAEIMAGAYSDNQPDYSWMQPHEVKIITQSWFPLREMGGVLNANPEGAINLTVSPERVAHIAVNTTSMRERARVALNAGEVRVYEEEADIDPAKPFVDETPLPEGIDAAKLKVSVCSSDGRELVSYAPRSYPVQEMPKPVLPPPAPQDIKTNEELYLTGLRLEQFYNPTVDPRPYYEEALKRDPDDARVNTALALGDCKRLDFASAEERLRRAVARLTRDYTRPRDGEALYYLGVALAAQGKDEEARDNFNRAAWSLAWHSAALFAVAELDCRDGDFARALEHLDDALVTNARDTRAMSLRSAVLRRLGRNQEALEQARAALAIDPLDCFAGNEEFLANAGEKKAKETLHALSVRMRGDVHSHLELASDYMGATLWDEAIDVLKRLDVTGGAAGSSYPMLYYYLAYCLEQRGDKDAATTYYQAAAGMPPEYCFPYGLDSMRVLERAMEANPADGRAPYYLGNLLYDAQPERAVATWEKARELSPELATLHRNLGYAYARSEEVDKAIASYQASVQCNTADPRVFYELELLYEKAGTDPAKRLALLNSNPETVLKRDDLIARKIMLLVQVGQYDEAITMLTSRTFDTWEGGGGGIHNVFVNAYSLRGLAALRRGDPQAALPDLTAALDYPANLGVDRPLQDPPAARTEFLLGLASEAAGNADAARTHYQNAAAMDVQNTEFRFHKAQALLKLGSTAEAAPLFDALIADGTKQLAEGAKVDFFAAFGEKVSHDKAMAQGHYLIALGSLGKGEADKAAAEFQEALKLDPNHLWARADSQGQ